MSPRPQHCQAPPSAQRGIALVLVLWIAVLITVLLASFSLSARVEALQGRNLLDSTRARYMAEAGLHRAVYELRGNDPATRWVADGREYEIAFEGAKLEIAIRDETGKIGAVRQRGRGAARSRSAGCRGARLGRSRRPGGRQRCRGG